MSRFKFVVLSLILVAFVFCVSGSSSYAHIGPGGDTIGAGGNMPQNGPDKPGAGGNTPTDGPPKGFSGFQESPDMPGPGGNTPQNGPDKPGAGGNKPTEHSDNFILTPLSPVKPGLLIYEVFNAVPGGPIYIYSGLEPGGGQDTKVCPMVFLDIFDLTFEDVLVADDTGYAAGIIEVPDVKPGLFKALYMQALDVKGCGKSNLTAYPLPQNTKF